MLPTETQGSEILVDNSMRLQIDREMFVGPGCPNVVWAGFVLCCHSFSTAFVDVSF